MVSRRQFIRADFNGQCTEVRPPWVCTDEMFTQTCTACNDCIDVCPEKIIVAGTAGYPAIDFSRGECTFCERCDEVCEPRAINKSAHSKPWNRIVEISPQCLANQNIFCRSCAEICETEAIQFQLTQGIQAPQLSTSACNGCGACIGCCPVNAINSIRQPAAPEIKHAVGDTR